VQAELSAKDIEHPGLRVLYECLIRLQAEGHPPELDLLRPRIENPQLLAKALELQEHGRQHPDRKGWLEGLLTCFRERRALPERQQLHNQLHAAQDHMEAVELLRQLQNRASG
jgi:hypothetical protein